MPGSIGTGAAALLGALLLLTPALAKEGVHAELERPVRLGAPAGSTVTVAFRLIDDEGRPFGASGIYLRVSRCGRGPLKVPATSRGRGRFSARLTVPRGLRKLRVGLEGIRMVGGKTEPADLFFDFEPPLRRACP